METIYNLASGPLYLLAVVCVFLSAGLLAYGVFEKGSAFMVNYKETSQKVPRPMLQTCFYSLMQHDCFILT